MSVTVNGFAQHMVSYYSVEDVLAGKLRSPSTIPELASVEISPEYLHKQNFRFPPMIEVGQDGVPRYRWVKSSSCGGRKSACWCHSRGEPEEPTSPQSPTVNQSLPPSSFGGFDDPYDPYKVDADEHNIRTGSTSFRHRTCTDPATFPYSSERLHPRRTVKCGFELRWVKPSHATTTDRSARIEW